MQNGRVKVIVSAKDNFGITVKRAAKAMRSLAAAFNAKANIAGYYIVNHRGRNKLRMIPKPTDARRNNGSYY